VARETGRGAGVLTGFLLRPPPQPGCPFSPLCVQRTLGQSQGVSSPHCSTQARLGALHSGVLTPAAMTRGVQLEAGELQTQNQSQGQNQRQAQLQWQECACPQHPGLQPLVCACDFPGGLKSQGPLGPVTETERRSPSLQGEFGLERSSA